MTSHKETGHYGEMMGVRLLRALDKVEELEALVAELTEFNVKLQNIVIGLAGRCVGQSELLSKKAEKGEGPAGG